MPAGASTDNQNAEPRGKKPAAEASLIEMLMRRAPADLDHIAEPTAAELDAIDELEEFDELDTLDALPPEATLPAPAVNPALALLAELDEPELLSLESLDDAEPEQALDDDIDEVDDLLDDVESLIEDYVDLDLDDDELQDEGYDLDDEEDGSYRDLYGDDDTIIPSFREGEFAEEEDGDTDYYNELR